MIRLAGTCRWAGRLGALPPVAKASAGMSSQVLADDFRGSAGVLECDLVYDVTLFEREFVQLDAKNRSELAGHTCQVVVDHVSDRNIRHSRIICNEWCNDSLCCRVFIDVVQFTLH